jgi:predicted amidohydrolase
MVCRMQKLAKELDVVIPVSFFEEANNAHYNSVAIIDADGTDLGLYRKSHIPDGPGIKCRQHFVDPLLIGLSHLLKLLLFVRISREVLF